LDNEIEKIARENAGKTILIASHSVAIRSFWYRICGYTDANTLDRVKFIVNSAYGILTYEDGRFIPGEYGLAPHLSEGIEYLI
jgi:broad specificity phosphatase PhoE